MSTANAARYACFDVGNTRLKVGIFDANGALVAHYGWKNWRKARARQLWKRHQIQAAIWSSVRAPEFDRKPLRWLGKHSPRVVVFDPTTPLPLHSNQYQTPQTLGRDRLAAAIGAHRLYPAQAVLAIDMGTCIKYDFVTAAGDYLGGSISPGLEMRFEALYHYTGRLPRVEKQHLEGFVGYSTETAIQTGVQEGIFNELSGFIGQYQQQFGELVVVLTGGDAHFFESRLKNRIFTRPFLVLEGLFQILKYNVQ